MYSHDVNGNLGVAFATHTYEGNTLGKSPAAWGIVQVRCLLTALVQEQKAALPCLAVHSIQTVRITSGSFGCNAVH